VSGEKKFFTYYEPGLERQISVHIANVRKVESWWDSTGVLCVCPVVSDYANNYMKGDNAKRFLSAFNLPEPQKPGEN
jgi:hypothetical protein